MSAAGIIEHFSALPDPRVHARKNEHELIDIIVIAVCAVRRCEKGLVRRFLETAERLLSLDTFNMLFSFINPDEFQRCFSGWIRAAVELTQGQVVAVDRKTLRRSHDAKPGKSAIHMVSSWAA